MDAPTVINAKFAVVFALLAVAFWRISRPRRPSEAERAAEARARVGLPPVDGYEGPDSLRLMEDLDAHLDAYASRLAGLYERLGPPPGSDPMWEAGRERLWDAVRDQHNHHQGDQ